MFRVNEFGVLSMNALTIAEAKYIFFGEDDFAYLGSDKKLKRKGIWRSPSVSAKVSTATCMKQSPTGSKRGQRSDQVQIAVPRPPLTMEANPNERQTP